MNHRLSRQPADDRNRGFDDGHLQTSGVVAALAFISSRAALTASGLNNLSVVAACAAANFAAVMRAILLWITPESFARRPVGCLLQTLGRVRGDLGGCLGPHPDKSLQLAVDEAKFVTVCSVRRVTRRFRDQSKRSQSTFIGRRWGTTAKQMLNIIEALGDASKRDPVL
jgi:hypothetical protein